MRKQFFNYLSELAKDKSVIFLTGDLGYSFFEDFRDKHPQQFINVGICEQSMVGIAAGLALGGKKPYVYSCTPFLIFRALEQIRNDVCYNNLNVKLIGTGAAGFLGFSHNLEGKENEEDTLKNLPNLKRYYPKNQKELKKSLISSYKHGKPSFIRI